MFLRIPHSAEMYGISCRNDFWTKQKVFPGNSEILCDRNVVRHHLKNSEKFNVCGPGGMYFNQGGMKTLHLFQSALQSSHRSVVNLLFKFTHTYNGLNDILIL